MPRHSCGEKFFYTRNLIVGLFFFGKTYLLMKKLKECKNTDFYITRPRKQFEDDLLQKKNLEIRIMMKVVLKKLIISWFLTQNQMIQFSQEIVVKPRKVFLFPSFFGLQKKVEKNTNWITLFMQKEWQMFVRRSLHLIWGKMECKLFVRNHW